MNNNQLIDKINKLSPKHMEQVHEYINSLLKENQSENTTRKGYGALKGKIFMSPDFDDPLDDFKEYM